ncbi:NAD(P)-binding protein [Acaromyces ingoldii]|uniref:NAD(P)-binding protein n=1 Tax=Acaromyces ingoldii TaxID=215250 RepID=A0A316YEL9_9BASI|nr:NAD(P)-binding protein [Acaromyces ingoldii]PWN88020.1 NAD(P)-binding protein [Acaromyces ingoldii]
MVKRVLVLLSTGKQGRCVVETLSGRHFQVIALARTAQGPVAQQLASLPNVSLLEGDIGTEESANSVLVRASADGPLNGVVLIQRDEYAVKDGEVEEAKRVVEQVKKHHVGHIVYLGMDMSTTKETTIPYVENKRRVDALIRESASGENAYKWTILRPSTFFENLTDDPSQAGFMITLCTKLIRKPAPWVSTRDTAHFAAASLESPGTFHGKTIPLAGDLVDRQRFEEEWLRAGLPKRILDEVPESAVIQALEGTLTYGLIEFLNSTNAEVDIAHVRAIHPQVVDLRAFLEANKDVLAASLNNKQ